MNYSPHDRYISSDYIKSNPDYHQKDSPFKWKRISKCLFNADKKKKIELSSIKSVCEIGCGAGGILNQINTSKFFPSIASLEGWDVSPDAINMASSKYRDINFFCDDLLQTDKHFDLIICADVFEHVENAYEFLKSLKKHGKLFVFYIPLEANLLSVIRGPNPYQTSYNEVGHLHFYSAASVELLLSICSYQKIHKMFSNDRVYNFWSYPSLRKSLIAAPQFFVHLFSPYTSSVIFGDHLAVLCI